MRHRVLRRIGNYHLDRVPVPAIARVLVRVIGHHNSHVQVLCVPRKCHRARVIRRTTPGPATVLLEQHQLPALLKRDLALELRIRPVRRIAVQCNACSLRVVEHVLCAQRQVLRIRAGDANEHECSHYSRCDESTGLH